MRQWWLVLRYILSSGVGQSGSQRRFNLTSVLALSGMVLGVASLVITMSVVSGVESFLKSSIIDTTGHIMLWKTGGVLPTDHLEEEVKGFSQEVLAVTPFVHQEAVLAHDGQVSGVIIQGFDPKTVDSVLSFKNRMISGEYRLTGSQEAPALLGKELAKRFRLKLDDIFQIVVPKRSYKSPAGFLPRTKKFRVVGVLDLGKYEFNARYVVTNMEAVQTLGGFDQLYSGLRIKLSHPDDVRAFSFRLGSHLGASFWTQDWIDVNKNYFSAVQYEKVAIFLVLLCMVVVASFNISSTLFVNVLKKYRDIAILKTMGASEKFLVRLFVAQGVFVGALGVLLGVGVGFVLMFLVSRSSWLYIPAEIYKFDHLPVEVRWTDLCLICVVSLLICGVSSFRPALKGARMDPVEGLRYE